MRSFIWLIMCLFVLLMSCGTSNSGFMDYELENKLKDRISLEEYDLILLFADYNCSKCKQTLLEKLRKMAQDSSLTVGGIYRNANSIYSFKYDLIAMALSPEIVWISSFEEEEKRTLFRYIQDKYSHVPFPVLIYINDGRVAAIKSLSVIDE